MIVDQRHHHAALSVRISFWFSQYVYVLQCLSFRVFHFLGKLPYKAKEYSFAICTFLVYYTPPPPPAPAKVCITFVFNFSWVLQWSQEKLKTILMHIFLFFLGVGGQDEQGVLWEMCKMANRMVFVWWPLARKELIGPLTGLLFISAGWRATLLTS